MVDILYEDNHVIVCIKPHNIPSQEDESKDKDMLTMVKEYIKEKYNKPGNVYVGLVHRLDRPTGGIMVFAKTSKAAQRLSDQIKNGIFHKKYLAVVCGKPVYKDGTLVHYLKKDEKNNRVNIVPSSETGAKRAELDYEVVDYTEKYSLVSVLLKTGRSHQIRVQMASLKTPIFGDAKYGGESAKNANLALWAYSLEFVHPTTQVKMNFKACPNVENIPWNEFEKKINLICK